MECIYCLNAISGQDRELAVLFDAGRRRYAICPDCQTDPLLKLVEGYQEARRDAMEAIQAKDRWIGKHADAMAELKAVLDAAKQAIDRLETGR